MDNNSLLVSNTAESATDIMVFTAKTVTLDGAVYKAHHTSEGFKVPIVYPQITKNGETTSVTNKACYVLLPKEEIVKCLREYLQEIIDPSILKSTET